MKNIIHNFVLKYIRNHLSHEHSDKRKDIISALVNGASDEFYEDNIPTRYHFLLKLMLSNDDDYSHLIMLMNRDHKSTEMPKWIGGVAKQAAEEVASKLGYWEKI